MAPGDMIFISVDDHVVEPPRHVRGAHARPSTPTGRRGSCAPTRATTSGCSTAQTIPNIGLNAVAGRPKEEYGIDPTSFDEMRPGLLRHPRAGQGHERRRRAGVDVLPVVPVVLRPAVRRHRRQGPGRSPSVRAYNDWHIDEWCGAYPGRFIPMALPDAVGPRAGRRRDPPGGGQGLPLADLHREPGHPRLPELPQRPLGPDVAGARRRRARSSTSTSARRASWRSPRPTRRST